MQISLLLLLLVFSITGCSTQDTGKIHIKICLKVLSNGTGGGGVSGTNLQALYSSTFPPILKKILKDPGPLENKKHF